MEPETATALQAILDDGSFEEMFTPYNPLKGQSATFSVKFRTLQRSGDVLDLKENDPFLFDGRTMAKGAKPALQDYPPSLLAAGNLLAVETNISTFDMSGKGDSSGRRGYSFSIGELYFLGDDDLSPPLESRERQGNQT